MKSDGFATRTPTSTQGRHMNDNDEDAHTDEEQGGQHPGGAGNDGAFLGCG